MTTVFIPPHKIIAAYQLLAFAQITSLKNADRDCQHEISDYISRLVRVVIHTPRNFLNQVMYKWFIEYHDKQILTY